LVSLASDELINCWQIGILACEGAWCNFLALGKKAAKKAAHFLIKRLQRI